MPQKPRTRRASLRGGQTGPGSQRPDPGANGQSNGGEWASGARIEWLDPKLITWPAGRITSEYDEERWDALCRSLAKGQHDALGVVQLEDGSYEGASGINRWTAAIEIGKAQVFCVVRQGTHRDVVKENLATALNQSRANPLSEVEGIAHAYYDEGFDLEELLSVTGKGEDWIENRLSISQASPAVKQCLGEGRIAIGHAAVLAGIDGHTAQEEALGLQLAHGWTVGQLTEHLQGTGDGPGVPNGRRQPRVRGPMVCSYCETERDRADVQTLNVCSGCAARLKKGAQHTEPVQRAGEVAVPVGLLRDAESVLAGSQAGAGLAERIAVLLEGVQQ